MAHDVRLPKSQGFASSYSDHLLHQIHASDHLGHRVLDLDAGIHLNEEECTRVVFKEIFDRACATIATGSREAHCGGTEFSAHNLGQGHCRRLLPHFLTTPLQRTLALVQMYRIVSITEYLHFDVPRAADEPFEVEAAITKGGTGLRTGLGQQGFKLVRIIGNADAATTAARRRLDHHWKADIAREGCRSAKIGQNTIAPGDDWHSRRERRCLGGRLVAHGTDSFGGGTDENEACGFDGLGEAGVLREETIAGVDCIGAALPCCLKHRLDVEVGFRGLRSDLDRLVGEPNSQHVGVGRAVNLDSLDPQSASGPDDADRDLPPVGDQNLLQRHWDIRCRCRPTAAQA